MSEYKLKTPKQAEAVIGAYHKVEDAVVGAYKKIEAGTVNAYKQVEQGFVDRFLEKEGEPESQEDQQPPREDA